MKSPLALVLSLAVLSTPLYAADAVKTLCSLGAKGDGKTDDREAIIKALTEANGAPVDGEGKTYAVNGNVELAGVPVDLRNATLTQTIEKMDVSRFIPSAKRHSQIKVDPPAGLVKMLKGLPVLTAAAVGMYDEDPVLSGKDLEKVRAYTEIRTLDIKGEKDKTVSVQLNKVKIIRGTDPGAGSANGSSGLQIDYASPVNLTDVEVTGPGKGKGIGVSNCAKVHFLRVNIHDIVWAPFIGDIELPMESVKKDFGWNNFPIYVYRSAAKKFVRVRVQEQLSGFFLLSSTDVVLEDMKVAHLETMIEGKPYAIQADGMTINRVTNLLVKNCNISFVWEGIDFTGASGQDFVYENVDTQDCFNFGLKLAHPKQNGKLVDCDVLRSGNAGFEIEPGVENVEFVNCKALETGSSGYWSGPDGFRVAGGGKPGEVVPNRLSFINCEAINTEFKGAMTYGFHCSGDAGKPGQNITLKDCKAEGASKAAFFGFAAQ